MNADRWAARDATRRPFLWQMGAPRAEYSKAPSVGSKPRSR